MIVILKNNIPKEELDKFVKSYQEKGFATNLSQGSHTTVLGLIGDTSSISVDEVMASEYVTDVKRIQEPYKNANRKFHPMDTVVEVGGVKVGGGNFAVIAGPCSVESEEQVCEIAEKVKASGANFLRGGAFKPRTSPYAFQGLKAQGIRFLLEARSKTGLPIVTEVMDKSDINLFEEVDVIQVGARNMQNFELLKSVGKLKKPVLLKRGLANTIEELLMSAEYIMSEGNQNVILCERGIRTFETATRNTLDLSAIPVIKRQSHLPVIIDPSHATGIADFVEPLALAAVAAGADGLMIEVHNDPKNALCDGKQSLTPVQFDALMKKVGILQHAMKKFSK